MPLIKKEEPMPQYRLKQNVPDFEVVDGKFAGRKFRAGENYSEIPPEEKDKFEAVSPESKPDARAAEPKPAPAPAAPKEEPKKDEGGKK